MQITKCDICKKVTEDASGNVHVGLGKTMFFNHVEICADCGAPIMKLLRDINY